MLTVLDFTLMITFAYNKQMDNLTETNILDLKKWLGSGSINIFGLPFSGKDTHGHELAQFFDGSLIGGGDILRSEVGPDHIKKHIAAGNLAPTDEYLAIVLPYLSSESLKGKPLILSSVGRWHGEAESVLKATKESGHEMKAVIFLSVTEEEVYKRWHQAERGREDDISEEILITRLNEFNQKTLPVVDYYRQSGLLIEVNALPPKDEVRADVFNKLLKLALTS